MLAVAILSAVWAASGQLEFYIRAALNVGVTRQKIVKTILQAPAFAVAAILSATRRPPTGTKKYRPDRSETDHALAATVDYPTGVPHPRKHHPESRLVT